MDTKMHVPDEIDNKLVRLLAGDAWQKPGTLATKLDMNVATVRRRTKRLIQSDILKIVGLVDPTDFGLPLAAMIAFDVDTYLSAKVVDTLTQMPEIYWVSTCTGRFDIVAIALFPSTDYLSKFMMKRLVKLEGIKNIETFVCLDVLKPRSGVRPETGYYDLGILRSNSLDAVDKRLVEMLGKDAWQKTETLAKNLNLKVAFTRLRLKKLLNNNLIRISGIIDPARFGLKLTTVIAFHVDIYRLESVVETLAQLSEFNWVSTSTGQFDVIAIARFPSTDHYSIFLAEKLSRLEGVKDIETFICLDVKKGRYIPIT